MKLKVTPSDGSEPFEVEVKRQYGSGSINQYGIKHKEYRAFQFDDRERPSHYAKEHVGSVSFHGFLIGKKGISPMECYIKVIEDEPETNTTA
jgi:hypothetical protein